MSFGFSIGDFISLTQLAWNTVQNARKACGSHDELFRELTSLHIVLRRLQREAEKPESILNQFDDNQRNELRELVRGCRKVLKTLNEILEKYNALSEEKRSVTKLWQKVKFGNAEMLDMSTLRLELSTHMNSIILFLNLLTLDSQMEVLKHMRSHGTQLSEVQQSINWALARQASTSERSVFTSYADDDKKFWRELRRELVKDGHSSSVLKQHKNLIKEYIVELGNRGALDEPEFMKEESRILTVQPSKPQEGPMIETRFEQSEAESLGDVTGGDLYASSRPALDRDATSEKPNVAAFSQYASPTVEEVEDEAFTSPGHVRDSTIVDDPLPLPPSIWRSSSPPEDSPYRKRRDGESYMKAFFPSSPKTTKPIRHDSGISAGSTSSHGRKQRTPEEQVAHDKRKEERRAAKSKALEAESAIIDTPAPVEVVPPALPKRMSSSTYNRSHYKDDGDKRPKLFDIMKGESVVKTPFMVTDVPHLRQVVSSSSKDKTKIPIMERPRFETED